MHGLLELLLVEELEDEEDEFAAERRHGARAATRELDLLCRRPAGARTSGRRDGARLVGRIARIRREEEEEEEEGGANSRVSPLSSPPLP